MAATLTIWPPKEIRDSKDALDQHVEMLRDKYPDMNIQVRNIYDPFSDVIYYEAKHGS